MAQAAKNSRGTGADPRDWIAHANPRAPTWIVTSRSLLASDKIGPFCDR
jgi:hypothetical protein